MRKCARLGALTLLTAALVTTIVPTAAAQEQEPIRKFGRNAPTYNSPYNAKVPTSRWVASAQGEDAYNAKGERNSFRGRAAVQETFGIKRVRIYDVMLQRWFAGKWRTALYEPRDKVSDIPKAYAVQYTPKEQTCWTKPTLTRLYRVINYHAIRRVDDVVTERTTYSKNFTAPALYSDPSCPKITQLVAVITGPDFISQGEHGNFFVVNLTTEGLDGKLPEGVYNTTAKVVFSEHLVVLTVPDNCRRVEDTNAFTCSTGDFQNLTPTPEVKHLEWEVMGSEAFTTEFIEVEFDGPDLWAFAGHDVKHIDVTEPTPVEEGATP